MSFSERNERTLKLFSPIQMRDNFSLVLCVPAQSIKARDFFGIFHRSSEFHNDDAQNQDKRWDALRLLRKQLMSIYLNWVFPFLVALCRQISVERLVQSRGRSWSKKSKNWENFMNAKFFKNKTFLWKIYKHFFIVFLSLHPSTSNSIHFSYLKVINAHYNVLIGFYFVECHSDSCERRNKTLLIVEKAAKVWS